MTAAGLAPALPSADLADLEGCASEPIHVPGSIQPRGCLLVLAPEEAPASLRVRRAAIGPIAAGLLADRPIGRPLAEAVPGLDPALIAQIAAPPEDAPAYLGRLRAPDGAAFHMIAHRSGANILLEFEAAAENEPAGFDHVYPTLRSFLSELHAAGSAEELGALAAREVRRITGFDRALVYRFDADGSGTVVAEDGNGVLPSYLGLRFPASDIPAQARELYRLNRLRLIPDADYRPVPIEPAGPPVDLSFAVLRSVSPVHLEYMRNMGTAASMSISLLRGDTLWGLISCHNRSPRSVAWHVRTACDFLGQILSLQISAREQSRLAERRIALRSVHGRLLARMAAEESFVEGLVSSPADLLGLTQAAGAAIVAGEQCRLVGETPSVEEVRQIVQWLDDRPQELPFATDNLAVLMPGAQALKDSASGLLAISISQIHASYVLWFRPEVVRTVAWGGEPVKTIDRTPDGARIHPRQSFEVWKETVRLRSVSWDEAEVEAADHLRSAIVDIVLRGAEEMAALADQLSRSNRELEAFSYSVSHDLRAPFRHIVGYAQLLRHYEGEHLSERANRYINTISESALSAGKLVDNLLSFSQMGRATLNPMRIDMNALVAEMVDAASVGALGRRIEWHVGPLQPARADPTMMRLVLQNLIENAVKFTRDRDPAIIEIGSELRDGEALWWVADNGTGFDMAYVNKLFGVFQRLHRVEEFEGTGIGLANVKRIVEQRHGGRVWAEGQVDRGAKFTFALPMIEEKR